MCDLKLSQQFSIEAIARCIDGDRLIPIKYSELLDRLKDAHGRLLVLIESEGDFVVEYADELVSSDEALQCANSALDNRLLDKETLVAILVQTLQFVFHVENVLEVLNGSGLSPIE